MSRPWLRSGHELAADLAHAAVRNHDLRRDVGARDPDRRHQPRPGLPRHRRAPRDARGREGGDRRRVATSTRPAPACPSCWRRWPRTSSASTASPLDPGSQVLVTAGRHRGDRVGGPRAVRARRRGGHLRALLRLVCRHDRPRRRDPPHVGAAVPRLRGRRGVAAGGLLAAHAARPAQHAAQPDREGLHAGRARAGRRPGAGARRVGRHRRGLRAPRLRRRRARADGDPAGDVRPHHHDQLGRQDVLGHGLEGRLALGAGRGGRGRAHRQAVPHLRRVGALPAGRRAGPRARRRGVCRARAPPSRPSATCCARRSRRRACRWPARRAPTSSSRTPRPSGRSTGSSSRGGCRTSPGWWGCRSRSSTTTRTPHRTLVRFAFCKRDEVLLEASHRLAAAGTPPHHPAG